MNNLEIAGRLATYWGRLSGVCSVLIMLSMAQPSGAQRTEYLPGIEWPEPAIVAPGPANSDPPSDAIVLFDGQDLSAWENGEKWKVEDGVAIVGEGYISTKPTMMPVYPFKEDGIIKDDVIRILEESGVGIPEYYSWRSRSGCYFCFFQQRGEWVRLREQHPDLWEKAKAYEKPEEGFTWVQGESLLDLEKPDRIEQIKEREKERQARLKARRKPRNLAEAFGGVDEDSFDDDTGCLICHL